ncbi:tetrathionate reductase family octaheme c-type cytochrome [Maritimibacter sp. HL-12]|uniref:tetrathionate reductase family octaheme c-type cytochrome n=1 Tax=Maritimibacter sp. HL-12 TaxID=1162418 RepID=UPI000A0F2BC6|nr:tetrathionate reductase family octaheme c-type cytochrome [Maritimibacter sp. HL-12]SMH56461.1 octaheme c-type cytochrome, tetrathionate reductase family [Maritimibacter sp. HL-12]
MQRLASKAWLVLGLGLWLGVAGSGLAQNESVTTGAPPPPERVAVPSTSTADHSKFEILQKEFASGPEVTAACLSCHTEADDQVMHSIHYQWKFDSSSGQTLGKSEVLNSFCGNVAGNEPRCTSCHAGYGWDDMASPPPAQSNAVDCLACHDRSGQYTKLADAAGHPPLEPVKAGAVTISGQPAWAVDLAKAAQSVGQPGRDNCGNCHFYGGGGDNVKHGDLSSVLFEPSLAVDVHMSPEGENFTCSTCHVSDQHEWAGSRYEVHATDPGTGKPGERRDVATCESCHSADPHPTSLIGMKLNDHVDVVACQTCHIPEFARGGVATKTVWDWSTAGRLSPEGKPMHEENYVQGDGKALHTYLSTKGDFEWGENVVPHYAWFDGQVDYTTGDMEIDPSEIVEVNRVHGAREDGRSRIWPFKLMEGSQSYDAGFNKLAYAQVWGPDTDTAFWTNFDWSKAIEAGMKAAGSEYSGEFGFVDTHMYWPITHMVAPASDALDCVACHAEDSRLAGLAGVYMPGTDTMSWIGILGRLMVLGALLGVIGHGLLRLVNRSKGGSHHG